MLSSTLPTASINSSLTHMMASQEAHSKAHQEAFKIQVQITQEKLFSLYPTSCTTYLPSTWNSLLLLGAVDDLGLGEAEEHQQRLSWVRKHQMAQVFVSAPSCLSFMFSSQLCQTIVVGFLFLLSTNRAFPMPLNCWSCVKIQTQC